MQIALFPCISALKGVATELLLHGGKVVSTPETTKGEIDALDHFCSLDDSLVTGNGFVIHVGRLYPHSAGFGSRNGVDPNYPGAKSHLAA